MKKFFCVYRVPVEAMEAYKKNTPLEEQKRQDAELGVKMGEWLKKYDKEIVDKGLPLGKNTRLTLDGAKPTTNDMNYYCTIEAASVEDAIAIIKDGLVLFEGAYIDIMEVPEMKM